MCMYKVIAKPSSCMMIDENWLDPYWLQGINKQTVLKDLKLKSFFQKFINLYLYIAELSSKPLFGLEVGGKSIECVNSSIIQVQGKTPDKKERQRQIVEIIMKSFNERKKIRERKVSKLKDEIVKVQVSMVARLIEMKIGCSFNFSHFVDEIYYEIFCDDKVQGEFIKRLFKNLKESQKEEKLRMIELGVSKIKENNELKTLFWNTLSHIFLNSNDLDLDSLIKEKGKLNILTQDKWIGLRPKKSFKEKPKIDHSLERCLKKYEALKKKVESEIYYIISSITASNSPRRVRVEKKSNDLLKNMDEIGN